MLHEQNLFVSVKHHEVPWIGFEKRVEVESLDNDCWQVTLHFGFKNEPDVPDALKLLEQRGVHLDEMETSYFLSPRHRDSDDRLGHGVGGEALREHAPQRGGGGGLPPPAGQPDREPGVEGRDLSGLLRAGRAPICSKMGRAGAWRGNQFEHTSGAQPFVRSKSNT